MKVMLAKPYEETDPTGWWVSEKLDGVRAIWTGTEFVSRNDKPIYAPEWFKSELPPITLDGELFAGRGAFQQAVSAVRKLSPVDAEWAGIRYHVFDAPNASGGFEDRIQLVDDLIEGSPVATVVEHIRCNSRDHLQKLFQKFTSEGAEGVMLRKPHSMYEGRRSPALLKMKPSISEEMVVIAHQPGVGKHSGRLGALICRWNDIEVGVGTGFTDTERENPPPVGSAVTVMFQELTQAGVPRFPVFVAVRDYE